MKAIRKAIRSIVLVAFCGTGAFVVTVALRSPTMRAAPQVSHGGAREHVADVDTTGATSEVAPRRDVAGQTLVMPEGQVAPAELNPSDHKVCDFRVETPPDDVLAETPMRTRAGLAGYLATHAAGFDELRRSIVPSIYFETERARRCWKEQGGSTKVEVDVTFSLESNATSARAERFAVRAARGADADLALARSCLEGSLLRPGFVVAAAAKASPFAPYSGKYPNVHHVVLQ